MQLFGSIFRTALILAWEWILSLCKYVCVEFSLRPLFDLGSSTYHLRAKWGQRLKRIFSGFHFATQHLGFSSKTDLSWSRAVFHSQCVDNFALAGTGFRCHQLVWEVPTIMQTLTYVNNVCICTHLWGCPNLRSWKLARFLYRLRWICFKLLSGMVRNAGGGDGGWRL